MNAQHLPTHCHGPSAQVVERTDATYQRRDFPLKFLEFIEDAARVLPPQCRSKLPRCMTVATPDNPIFNISKRVGCWFEV